MCESYLVLVYPDEENKTYYVRRQSFAAGSNEAKMASEKHMNLLEYATINHYHIEELDRDLDEDNELGR